MCRLRASCRRPAPQLNVATRNESTDKCKVRLVWQQVTCHTCSHMLMVFMVASHGHNCNSHLASDRLPMLNAAAQAT